MVRCADWPQSAQICNMQHALLICGTEHSVKKVYLKYVVLSTCPLMASVETDVGSSPSAWKNQLCASAIPEQSPLQASAIDQGQDTQSLDSDYMTPNFEESTKQPLISGKEATNKQILPAIKRIFHRTTNDHDTSFHSKSHSKDRIDVTTINHLGMSFNSLGITTSPPIQTISHSNTSHSTVTDATAVTSHTSGSEIRDKPETRSWRKLWSRESWRIKFRRKVDEERVNAETPISHATTEIPDQTLLRPATSQNQFIQPVTHIPPQTQFPVTPPSSKGSPMVPTRANWKERNQQKFQIKRMSTVSMGSSLAAIAPYIVTPQKPSRSTPGSPIEPDPEIARMYHNTAKFRSDLRKPLDGQAIPSIVQRNLNRPSYKDRFHKALPPISPARASTVGQYSARKLAGNLDRDFDARVRRLSTNMQISEPAPPKAPGEPVEQLTLAVNDIESDTVSHYSFGSLGVSSPSIGSFGNDILVRSRIDEPEPKPRQRNRFMRALKVLLN